MVFPLFLNWHGLEGQGQRQLIGLIWAWLAAAGDSAERTAVLEALGGPLITFARAFLQTLLS